MPQLSLALADAPAQPFPGERRFLSALLFFATAIAIPITAVTRDPAWVAGYVPGVALVGYGLALWRRTRVARTWPTVPGRLLQVMLMRRRVDAESSSDAYFPEVLYAFSLGGRTMQSRRFGLAESFFCTPQAFPMRNLLLAMRGAGTVPVHVSPAAPGWAVLRADMLPRARQQVMASIAGGMGCILVSLAVAWWQR